MFGLGMGELVILLVVVLLLFGGKKLPELGGSMAKAIKNFKTGLSEVENEKKEILSTITNTKES